MWLLPVGSITSQILILESWHFHACDYLHSHSCKAQEAIFSLIFSFPTLVIIQKICIKDQKNGQKGKEEECQKKKKLGQFSEISHFLFLFLLLLYSKKFSFLILKIYCMHISGLCIIAFALKIFTYTGRKKTATGCLISRKNIEIRKYRGIV